MNVAFKDPQTNRSLDALAEALLLPSGIDGVYARTAIFEDVVTRLAAFISRHREPGTEVLRFPPVMSRRQLERSGYLKSFPHFLGCVCCLSGSEADVRGAVERFEAGEDWTDALSAADLVLTPAACYPVYPIVASRGAVPAEGLAVRCRQRLFPPRAVARSRPAAVVPHARICLHRHARTDTPNSASAGWSARKSSRELLGLPYRVDQASDPFFGRGGKLMAMSQIEQSLKFELLDSGPLGRAADRLHELQLSPRSLRHGVGPAQRGRRGRCTPAASPSAWIGLRWHCSPPTGSKPQAGPRRRARRSACEPVHIRKDMRR